MRAASFERPYALIKLLRKPREAPVDDHGPTAIADLTAHPDIYRYHILCALQLSSMTKDQKTHEAIRNLREFGLTVDNISQTPTDVLEGLIKPVGFYRRKAEHLKASATILKEQHQGKVPNNLEALMALPGIGPKMAHITLKEAFGQVEGIGVDSHMHRICNKLGWVKSKTPEDTRKQLEAFLPREEWGLINHEIVGLGQMVQQPTYRVKLARALLGLKDDSDFSDALDLLRKIDFPLKSLEKLDEKLYRDIVTRTRESSSPKKKKVRLDDLDMKDGL